MGSSSGLRPRKRRTGRHTVTVVVYDDLFEGSTVRPGETITLACGHLSVRYLRQSVAEREGIEADEWICPQPPRVTGRRPLFETVIGETFEQDPDGTLVYDGHRQSPGTVLSFGEPDEEHEWTLRVGHRAAILLGEREASGMWRAKVGVTCALLWVYALPTSLLRRQGRTWLASVNETDETAQKALPAVAETSPHRSLASEVDRQRPCLN